MLLSRLRGDDPLIRNALYRNRPLPFQGQGAMGVGAPALPR